MRGFRVAILDAKRDGSHVSHSLKLYIITEHSINENFRRIRVELG